MKKLIPIISLLLTTAISVNAQKIDFPKLTGPYFGQRHPRVEPEIFAPEILIKSKQAHSNIVFSAEGTEAYWCDSCLLFSKLENGYWTVPAKAPFLKKYKGGAIHIMYDGKRLLLNRYLGVHELKEGEAGGIWVLQKIENGWDNARFLIEDGMRATSTLDGAIYATDISGR